MIQSYRQIVHTWVRVDISKIFICLVRWKAIALYLIHYEQAWRTLPKPAVELIQRAALVSTVNGALMHSKILCLQVLTIFHFCTILFLRHFFKEVIIFKNRNLYGSVYNGQIFKLAEQNLHFWQKKLNWHFKLWRHSKLF